ncbi:aspartate aminotransferase family protein [Evansella clarkii]|uniref:aspartate aminotransferase family protein n=1 Tax=Evansella clarkii TaxID=79879 RepID=UPI000B452F8B|nr:aspartate aminotransferase family protein [Evansella clarkii]
MNERILTNNDALKERANNVLVGGVSAAWNHLKEKGPVYFRSGDGAHIRDVDGNEYIDYLIGWGSLFLGHNPKVIRDALEKSIRTGFGFQYESEYHVELAELITDIIPCAEKVRLCNSGTEATMNAIRLARIKTNKKKIIKFEGHFHGQHDYLLYAMDTSPYLGEVRGLGDIKPIPGSGGIPDDLEDMVIPLPFNDKEAFLAAIEKNRGEIAGIILEPIMLNVGCVYPEQEFLELLREVSTKEDVVLIFDEVLTGFRVALGGAQELYNVTPDLACYGKAFGCGMPIAALAGKKEFMDELEPVGKGQMSGTNTGRLMSVLGTLEILRELQKPGTYHKINQLSNTMIDGLESLVENYSIPCKVQGKGGRIGIHFGLEFSPKNYRDIVENFNSEYTLACYRKAMDERNLFGFFLPLSNCPEPITLSLAHTEKDINETLTRVEDIFKSTPYF